MATFRVVQLRDAFGYAAGTAWGPYTQRTDAEQRRMTLLRHKSDGAIEFGDFGPPCAQKRGA